MLLFTEIDKLIIEVIIIMPLFDHISQFIIGKNDFLKQYTIWNLYIFFKFIYTNNLLYLHFLTTNTINIFIVFHSFFIIQPELLHIMPQKMNMSKTFFHFQNFLLHILPPIYCIYQLSYIRLLQENTHLYNNFFILIWILIIEKGNLKLDGVYTINNEHRHKLIVLMTILNIFTPKLLIYLFS
jgi:hypothetical protein